MADTMKKAWNARSVKTRKTCCGEVKKFTKAAARCNRREAGPCSLPSHLSQLPPLYYVPTSPTAPLHYSPTLTNLSPHSTHTPFPPYHFTPVIHLSHLPSSLLSHLSQLISLPTTNRHLQNNNLLPLSKQGKRVSPVVRWPLMKAGW